MDIVIVTLVAVDLTNRLARIIACTDCTDDHENAIWDAELRRSLEPPKPYDAEAEEPWTPPEDDGN